MFFSIAFDILVVLLILRSQRRIHGVPRLLRLRLPVFVGVLGLIEILRYTGNHHVSGSGWLWVLGSLAIGAAGLGALRALTVRLWTANNWVVRQGTALTSALWVLALALHLAVDAAAPHVGSSSIEASSFLLYIAVALGVQSALVHRRALPLWTSLGPEAGQRVQVNFGQGPGGVGSIFATFRNVGGAPGQPSGWGTRPTTYHDPTIIDAEVVDEEDPPHLR
jgi:hypothetical protein